MIVDHLLRKINQVVDFLFKDFDYMFMQIALMQIALIQTFT
jgi:hypothetical protein